MVWAIVVVAIGVLGVGAWAGTGRLGEMPGTVTDRPKAHIPDGPVDELFVADLSLPTAGTGYRRSQVDALLASHVSGADIEPGTRFDVVRNGYDMQAVDAVIERISEHEYPEVIRDTDDDDAIATVPDESSVVADHGTGTSEKEHVPLSEAGLDGEVADDMIIVEPHTEPSEQRK